MLLLSGLAKERTVFSRIVFKLRLLDGSMGWGGGRSLSDIFIAMPFALCFYGREEDIGNDPRGPGIPIGEVGFFSLRVGMGGKASVFNYVPCFLDPEGSWVHFLLDTLREFSLRVVGGE